MKSQQCEICWRSFEVPDLVKCEGKTICVRCEYKQLMWETK